MNGVRIGAEQPRRFERVRREHGGPMALLPALQARAQFGVGRDAVERIGIQHEAGRVLEDLGQNRAHRLATTAAAKPRG